VRTELTLRRLSLAFAVALTLAGVLAHAQGSARTKVVASQGDGSLQHAGSVVALVLSADGKRALSSGVDGMLYLWDVETGKAVASADVGRWTYGIALTADARRAIAAGEHATIWDLATGMKERTLEGKSPVTLVALSPEGDRALTAADDEPVHVFDTKQGTEVAALPGHTTKVRALAFFADGRALTATEGGTVRVFDPATWKATVEVELGGGEDESLITATPSPDGKRVLCETTTSYERKVRVLDLATKKVVSELKNPSSVAWAPDGKHVVAALNTPLWAADESHTFGSSWESALELVELETAKVERRFAVRPTPVDALAVTSDGRRVVTGGRDGAVRVFDLETGRELFERGPRGPVKALVPLGKRRVLVAGAELRLLDLAAATSRTLAGHRGLVTALAVSADGKEALSGGDDETVHLWDLAMLESVRTFAGPRGSLTAVAFDPDGKRIASGAGEGVRIWARATGKLLDAWEPENGMMVQALRFAAGRLFVLARGEVQAWRLDQPSPEVAFGDMEDAFSVLPDGERVLTGGHRRDVKVWSAKTGKLLEAYPGHTWIVEAVAVSPDGKLAASAGWDRTIRLWDLERGREWDRIDLSSSHDRAGAVAFGPEGDSLFVGTDRGVVLELAISR
jgi:WD40 repeat protein